MVRYSDFLRSDSEPGRRCRGRGRVARGVHEAGRGDAAARARGGAEARRRDEQRQRLLWLLDPRVDDGRSGGGGGRGGERSAEDGRGRRGRLREEAGGGRRGGRGGRDTPQDGVALLPRQSQLRVRHFLTLEMKFHYIDTEIWLLFVNIHPKRIPKSVGNLSEICQKSVR